MPSDPIRTPVDDLVERACRAERTARIAARWAIAGALLSIIGLVCRLIQMFFHR